MAKPLFSNHTGFAYVGLCPTCQRIDAVTSERFGHSRQINRDIAQFVRDGLTVKRMPSEEAKALMSTWCECTSQPTESVTPDKE